MSDFNLKMTKVDLFKIYKSLVQNPRPIKSGDSKDKIFAALCLLRNMPLPEQSESVDGNLNSMTKTKLFNIYKSKVNIPRPVKEWMKREVILNALLELESESQVPPQEEIPTPLHILTDSESDSEVEHEDEEKEEILITPEEPIIIKKSAKQLWQEYQNKYQLPPQPKPKVIPEPLNLNDLLNDLSDSETETDLCEEPMPEPYVEIEDIVDDVEFDIGSFEEMMYESDVEYINQEDLDFIDNEEIVVEEYESEPEFDFSPEPEIIIEEKEEPIIVEPEIRIPPKPQRKKPKSKDYSDVPRQEVIVPEPVLRSIFVQDVATLPHIFQNIPTVKILKALALRHIPSGTRMGNNYKKQEIIDYLVLQRVIYIYKIVGRKAKKATLPPAPEEPIIEPCEEEEKEDRDNEAREKTREYRKQQNKKNKKKKSRKKKQSAKQFWEEYDQWEHEYDEKYQKSDNPANDEYWEKLDGLFEEHSEGYARRRRCRTPPAGARFIRSLRQYGLEYADDAQIKKYLRKNALLCHPDRPTGSHEKFLQYTIAKNRIENILKNYNYYSH